MRKSEKGENEVLTVYSRAIDRFPFVLLVLVLSFGEGLVSLVAGLDQSTCLSPVSETVEKGSNAAPPRQVVLCGCVKHDYPGNEVSKQTKEKA